MDEEKSERLKLAEDALHAVLTAITEHEKELKASTGRESAGPRFLSAKALERADLQTYIDDPIAPSLRLAVRKLGEEIHSLADGFQAMRDAAERIAKRDAQRYAHRIEIIDKRWHGIGDWIA